MLLASLLVLLGFGGFTYSLKPASEYFQICRTKDPMINDCIKKSIEALRPQLVKGVPELNLVPLDPLLIPRLDMKEGNGNFKFRQTISNLNIYGLRNFEIKNFTVNLNKNDMTFVLFTKHIDVYGDYDMAGRMMVIDLKGTGKATVNFTDVTTTAFVQGEVIQKKGVEYFRVKSFKWKIEPGDMKSHFSNLFNGDKNLGEATNKFLNENWRAAFGAYRRLPEEAFGTLMKDLANRVYSLFPKDELYPK